MNKKLTVSILAIVAVVVVTIIAVAATKNTAPAQAQQKAQTATQTQKNAEPVSAQAPQRMMENSPMQESMGCNFSDLMLDENGELVSKEIFDKNIENELAKGNLSIEDKEFLLEMYEMMSGGEGCDEMGGGCPFGM